MTSDEHATPVGKRQERQRIKKVRELPADERLEVGNLDFSASA